MAKPTDMSRAQSPRAPSARKRRSRAQAKPLAAGELERWKSLVEEERGRLMKAHSILSCVIAAMEAEDLPANEGPYWPAVIESACELIDASIRRLEGDDYAARGAPINGRVEEPLASYASAGGEPSAAAPPESPSQTLH